MDGNPGISPTEVFPSPDEHAGDDAPHYAPTHKWPESSSGRDKL